MKTKNKPDQLIKRYSSAIIEGLAIKISASSGLKQKLKKGELRELFISNVLNPFLTTQFGIRTGIVINQKEEQSRQIDIIIYDNRILPPFIKEQHIGIYPAESVVGTIEIRSALDKPAILRSEESAKILHGKIYNPSASIYKDYEYIRPLSATLGFYGSGTKELRDSEKGKLWLEEHIKYNFAICLIGKFSWLNIGSKGWTKSINKKNFEETKRFIAVFVDNLRSISEYRLKFFGQFEHYDWLSVYIRDQDIFHS